jgi:hypothetical protein
MPSLTTLHLKFSAYEQGRAQLMIDGDPEELLTSETFRARMPLLISVEATLGSGDIAISQQDITDAVGRDLRGSQFLEVATELGLLTTVYLSQ